MRETDNPAEDQPPEFDEETVERWYREVMMSRSMERIARARSKKERIELCSQHLSDLYSEHWDLRQIADVLQGKKIPRPQNMDNVGVQIRVDEIRENEEVSFEEAVERFALKANTSASAVKKAITLAKKSI